MSKGITTIKEIAKQLNVAVSTVSRALNDHPRIGLRTKQRVQELAKELGYEPNAQAIFFKQKRTFIIGVVIPFIREEFFSQAISGIETAASEHSYTILFGQSYDDIEIEKRVVSVMKKQRVDGLIISLSKNTNKYDHLESFEKYIIPVVYFDRVPSLNNVHKVYCDIYKGTIDMINWLYRRGVKRIGFINGPQKLSASKERLDGYIHAVSNQKLKVDMRLVETTDFSKESTNTAIEKLLALKSPPQAILSFNDYVHMDAVKYARQHKIKVNKDIIFASYANLPITDYTSYPPVISLEQYPYKQGEGAMQIMIKILNEKANSISESHSFFIERLPPLLVQHSK